MKTVLKIFGGLFVVALIAVVAAVYFFGPSYGGVFAGKPVFLFNASEKRINTAMVDTAALTGIYGDSEEFQRAREAFEEDPTNAELLDAAIDAAGGKHSKVFSTESEKEIEKTAPVVNYDDGVLPATVPSIGRHDDGQAYADTLATGLTAHPEACAAVVDLRGNDGGDMGPMYAGLSPLLPDGPALSFVSRMGTTDVTIDGNSVTGGGTPTTTSGGKLEGPVAVLTDGITASSAEATLSWPSAAWTTCAPSVSQPPATPPPTLSLTTRMGAHSCSPRPRTRPVPAKNSPRIPSLPTHQSPSSTAGLPPTAASLLRRSR